MIEARNGLRPVGFIIISYVERLRLLANLWKISQAQPGAVALRVPTALSYAVSVQPLTAIQMLEERHREGSCENAESAFDQERYRLLSEAIFCPRIRLHAKATSPRSAASFRILDSTGR
jgi:hypothetical protein